MLISSTSETRRCPNHSRAVMESIAPGLNFVETRQPSKVDFCLKRSSQRLHLLQVRFDHKRRKF